MAASACFVPGPTSSPRPAAEGLPGLRPGQGLARLRKAGIALALSLWALCGFASGFALSVITVPEAEVSPGPAPTAVPGVRKRAATRGLEARFWRPRGSTALRPAMRLAPRLYQPQGRSVRVASLVAGAR